MRRLFTAMALVLCIVANAQTTYSFDMSAMAETDLNITNGSKDISYRHYIYANAATSTVNEAGETVIIPTEMTLQIKDYPILFTYTNSEEEVQAIFTNVLKDKKYLQVNVGNTNIHFENLNAGDVIAVTYSSHNIYNEEDISNGGLTNLIADDGNKPAPVGNMAQIVNTFYATESGEASIDNIPNGYLLYSITISPAGCDPTERYLNVEEKTIVPLTKENIETQDYLSVTTDNWSPFDKEYMGFTGKQYILKNTDCAVNIEFKGETAYYEIYVFCETPGREYTIKLDGKDVRTIYHRGTGIESSGFFECSNEAHVLTLSGTGNSVYPAAIMFYTKYPTVTLSIPACGLATLVSDKAIDCANLLEGVKAYGVIGYNEAKTKLKVEEINWAVAGGTGLLFEAEKGDYELPIASKGQKTSTMLIGNAFMGTEWTKPLTNGKTPDGFILDKEDGLFYVCSGGTIPAGKCYVSIDTSEFVNNPTAGAKGISFEIDGTPIQTGINEVETNTSGVMYNLNGMRVGKNVQKGVYIVNGKKVVK